MFIAVQWVAFQHVFQLGILTSLDISAAAETVAAALRLALPLAIYLTLVASAGLLRGGPGHGSSYLARLPLCSRASKLSHRIQGW